MSAVLPRILVIDDNPDDIVLLKSWIRQAPREYDVKEILNLSECENILSDFTPDCILLDGFLMDGDCFDLLRTIHQYVSSPPPVIVISAYDNKAFREDAIELGAKSFYSKNDLNAVVLDNAIQTILHEENDE